MTEQLATLLKEQRTYVPSPAFRRRAHVQSPAIYRQAGSKRLRFWADRARELEWFKPT